MVCLSSASGPGLCSSLVRFSCCREMERRPKHNMAEISEAPKVPKQKKTSLGDLIVKVVAASRERSGVSNIFIKQAVAASGYDVEKNVNRFNSSIKTLVLKGILVQVKGCGASGSYRINKAEIALFEKAKQKMSLKKTKKSKAGKKKAKTPKKVAKKAKAE